MICLQKYIISFDYYAVGRHKNHAMARNTTGVSPYLQKRIKLFYRFMPGEPPATYSM